MRMCETLVSSLASKRFKFDFQTQLLSIQTRELNANYKNSFDQIRNDLEGLISGFKKYVVGFPS